MAGMRRALLFEVRRVASVGSTWILLGLIFLVGLATSTEPAAGRDHPDDFPLGAVNHLTAGGVLAAAIGASAIGAELRWNTLRALYTAFPSAHGHRAGEGRGRGGAARRPEHRLHRRWTQQ